jgi:eukaryotic-like serine/threonine-protein kinase
MVLAPDTQLGPYRIVSFVGAGGMGEVYRATDLRLDRVVAIKTLAPSTTAGPDAIRRFEQEARAAAALNHPNILAVYDVGTLDGVPYIVSELLEGQTLRQCLDGHALPARKAVDYAIQIARGLGAVHATGIVHRDLKPENVFVTADGRIKILDFGLAKLRPATTTASASALTMMQPDTEPGLLLGTLSYMAPEQVRGQPADARTDLFALGAILYEMLTGVRAFARATPADTLSAILTEEPSQLVRLDAQIAPGLDRIVRHCLEKSPDQRFQSARDLAFDLETAPDISGAVPAAAMSRSTRGRFMPRWIVAAAAAGALLAWAAPSMIRRSVPAVAEYQQLTFRKGALPAARFANNGRTVVYAADWGDALDVYTVQDGSVESRSLGLKGADLLAASPSGDLAVSLGRRVLEGFTFSGTLARVPLGGGGARELLENVQSADWAPDGSTLAIIREIGGRTRLEYPIGTVLYDTTGWLSDVRVSSQGDVVAFIEHPFRHDDAGTVAVVDRHKQVTELSRSWLSVQGLAWSGREIWFTASKTGSNRAVYAVTLGGRLRPIAGSPGLITLHDVSQDGRALITRDSNGINIWTRAPGASTERDLSWLDWSRLRDLSADGRTVLFDETGQGGGARQGVYIRSTDGSPAIRLGDGTGEGLSPDGKWAISVAVDRSHIILLPTGAGESRTIDLGPLDRIQRAFWFPDGKHILVGGSERGHAARLYVQELAGGPPRPITPEGVAVDATISPDGQWAATRMNGVLDLFAVTGGARRTVPGVHATELVSRWTPDGGGLYLYDPVRLPIAIVRVDVATGERREVKQIAAPNASPIFGVMYLFVTPDLGAYAYATRHQDAELYLAQGLK